VFYSTSKYTGKGGGGGGDEISASDSFKKRIDIRTPQ
jgi:hypothetical protein